MSEQDSISTFLRDIPPELLELECSDQNLAEIAKKIVQWEILAPYFGIEEGEKYSLKKDCISYEEQKLNMLLKWKQKRGNATNQALLVALHSTGNVNLLHGACLLLNCKAKDLNTPMSSVLLQFQTRLKTRYKIHKPIMVSEWPPLFSVGYFKLVLVPKQNIARGEIANEDVYDEICRSVEGTLQDVSIEELLQHDSDERKVILFEGVPGSGKSTLLWHITQMWQSGEQFQQFTLVLLVQLKDPAVRMAKSLADLLPPRSKAEQVASEIEAIQGEGVLIMLDGWDEAPADLREEGSFLHNLIAKPCDWSVEKAAIVVSSRPLPSDDMCLYLSKRVALQGFKREMRELYIVEALKDYHCDYAKSLIEKIENAEASGSMDLSLPLNIASLINIFSTSGGDLPPTPCWIAIKLILSFLFRHIKKTLSKKSIKALNSFEDLPQPVGTQFQHICKIAYDGIVKEKFSFGVDELIMPPIGDTSSEQEVDTLGLLQPMHSLVSVGSSTVYHFLHLSHQELCAAYYIYTLPYMEHLSALRPIASSQLKLFYSFQSVYKFYAALTGLKVPSVCKALTSWYSSCDDAFISSINCGNEMELSNPGTLSQTGDELQVEWEPDGILYRDWDNDYVVVVNNGRGYLLSSFVEFVMESMNHEFIKDSVGKQIRLHIDKDTEGAFSALVSMSPQLESVTYYMHSISPQMFTALTDKPNLKIFVLYVFRCISDCRHFEAMKNSLQTCQKLEDIFIRVRFSDSVSNISVITETFKHLQLKNVNIDAKGSIDDAGIAELVPGLFNTSCVRIQCKEVGSLCLARLKDIFVQSSALRFLEMKIHQYGGEDREFFNSFKEAVSVEFVLLRNKDWTATSLHDGEPSLIDSAVGRVLLSGDLVELAHIFGLDSPPVVDKILHVHIFNSCLEINCKSKLFTSVSLVDCQHKYNRHFEKKNNIEVRNIIQLNGIQKLCTSLETVAVAELNLMSHNVGDRGALLLKDAIATASCLKELIIRNCNIREDGIAAVFAGLKHNPVLTELDASNNIFGDVGAVEVAKLINQTSLKVLDISDCGIREDGIVAIAAALMTNTTLNKISLHSRNQIISQTSELEISKAILKNKTLTVLRVNQNPKVYQSLFYSNKVNRYFKISQISMQSIRMEREEFYHAVKMSSVISTVDLDEHSTLGRALDSENVELAVEILQLGKLPAGKGVIELKIDGAIWKVDYERKSVSKCWQWT